MVNIDYLKSISELKMAWIRPMTIDELNNFFKSLDNFIESFPNEEEKINAALGAKDYDSLSRSLSVIRNMLVSIYADDLAKECETQIHALTKDIKHEKLEAFMAYYLKCLSMLSIDVQMAMLKNQEKTQEKSSEKPEEKPAETTEKKIILAVDDRAFFLTLLKKALEDIDHKLVCVNSANNALAFIAKCRPDLFLLDIEMPEMDGYELAIKIKESGHSAPIIFMTGNAKRECVLKAAKVGAVDFVVKPINKEEIIAKINKHI